MAAGPWGSSSDSGAVNASYEAAISLTVQGPSGLTRQPEAVIDTGFTGLLELSPALVTEPGLPFPTNESAMLADGSLAKFSVHDATVHWDGQPRRVYAHVSNTAPLMSMRLLDSHSLYVEVEDGGRVVIQARE